MTIAMLPGPYRIPAYRAVGHFRLTNKTPAATYRAPGRFEGSFVRERLIDAIADRLGLDRIDGPPAQPDHGRARCRSPGRCSALGTEVRLRFRRLRAAARQGAGADRLGRAAGRSCAAAAKPASWSAPASAIFVEKGGLGPLDGARVTVDTTGAVELVTGGSSVGQGFATAMAQICAETLGVDYRRVRVVLGQTDRIQYGIGAHASRASVMTGGATHAAALKVRAKALDMAAALLQAAPEELDIVDGVVVHRDRPGGPSIPLGDIARHLAPDSPTARRARSRALGGGLVPHRAHDLPLRRADRRRADRSRDRQGDGRALSARLRYRPGDQSDAGRGPAGRGSCAGARRRAVRRVPSTTRAASR